MDGKQEINLEWPYGPDQMDQGFYGPGFLKVITLKTSFSVIFYCILADKKHPDWFFGEFVNHIRQR